jgi:hypothetical protein
MVNEKRYIKQNERWKYICTHRDLVEPLSNYFHPPTFPLASITTKCFNEINPFVDDIIDYNYLVMDFNNGSLDLRKLIEKLNSNFNIDELTLDDFINTVNLLKEDNQWSEDIPKYSYDWNLITLNPTPKFLEFIKSTIPDNNERNNLYYYFGAALLNETEIRMIPVLFGKRDAGKSTLATIFGKLFKKGTTTNLQLSDISNPNNRFSLSKLLYKELIVFDDTTAKDIKDEGIFKLLVNHDNMSVEVKNLGVSVDIETQDVPFSIITTNTGLRIDNESVVDKLLYIKCGATVEKKDSKLVQKLSTEENLSYLILKSIYTYLTSELIFEDSSLEHRSALSNPLKYVINNLFNVKTTSDLNNQVSMAEIIEIATIAKNYLINVTELFTDETFGRINFKTVGQAINSIDGVYYDKNNSSYRGLVFNPDNKFNIDWEMEEEDY